MERFGWRRSRLRLAMPKRQSQDLILAFYQFRFGSSRLYNRTVSFWSKSVWTVELVFLALAEPDFAGEGQVSASVQLQTGRLTTYK